MDKNDKQIIDKRYSNLDKPCLLTERHISVKKSLYFDELKRSEYYYDRYNQIIYLNKINNSLKAFERNNLKRAKQFFIKEYNECDQKTSKDSPNSVFYVNKNNEIIFEYEKQNEKNDYFYVSYNKIWSVFESEFGYNYDEIRDLIKGILESHYKLESVTPIMPWIQRRHYWSHITNLGL